MTRSPEVTIAGKRYANAGAYIQAVVGALRTLADARGSTPVEVTVRPDEKLDADEIESLL